MQECLGFYAWQGNWERLFGASFPQTTGQAGVAPLLSRVPVVWFSFDEAGNLTTQNDYANRPKGWEKLMDECRGRGIAVDMTVAYLDGPKLEVILADDSITDRIVAGIEREVTQFDGVNIDLEGLGSKSVHKADSRTLVRHNFNRFLNKLRDRLLRLNKRLYVCVHPLNGWFLGYDYREIARLSDGLVVMAYHYGPTPEPYAPVEQSVTLALASGVPREKLILGILTLKPYEIPETLAEKVGIAQKHRIAGIALWKISFLNEEFQAVLRRLLRIR